MKYTLKYNLSPGDSGTGNPTKPAETPTVPVITPTEGGGDTGSGTADPTKP